MISAVALFAFAVLLTVAASIFDVETNDRLIRGPLTAVIFAFLIPGTLLLSVNVSRIIEAMPSKTSKHCRVSFILGTPRILFGTLAVAVALIGPFVALRSVSVGVVRGNADLLPLFGLIVAPMLLVLGDIWIRRGAGMVPNAAQRVRLGPWEIDALPFRVKALLLSSVMALGISALAFTLSVVFFDVTTAELVFRPASSVVLFLLMVPLAVLILRK